MPLYRMLISLFKNHRNICLSGLTAVLLFLSFPNANLYYFSWIALIPLLFVVSDTTLIKSFLFGLFSGFIAYTGIMYWIYPTISFYTSSWQQAALCLALLSLYMALYVGCWAFLIKAINPATSIFRFSLFSASLWVSLEYLRTYLFTGFPWALLGYSQWKFLPLIQIAEYVGVYGVSFLIIWINVGVYQFLRTKRWPSFLVLLSVFLGVIIFGRLKLHTYYFSSPPYINVAVIQANIDQSKKWDVAYEQEIMGRYTDLIEQASAKSPDLILWPETAVPGYLPSNALLFSWVSELAKKTLTYHLVGSPYYNGGAEYYNGVLLFDPEGEVLAWHKKTHLVPFGEYIPFRDYLAPYFEIINSLGDFSPGQKLTPFSIKSVFWGVTICSENFFPDITRELVNNGAEVIANQTNDAWYFKTSAAMQHFTMNVFRAVENRRPVVVCGNTGVSGLVEPSGSITDIIPIFEPAYFIGRVEPRRERTFYTAWGDLFSHLCVLATLFMMFSSILKKYYYRRKKALNKAGGV